MGLWRSSAAASSTAASMPTGTQRSPGTREKLESRRVIARTRERLAAMLARPFSSVSGVTPRLDWRIWTIEWIADSGFATS